VTTATARQGFDAAVIACHSHDALRLLEDPSREEQAVLGALRFGRSRRVLHSDARVMPGNRSAWSAWNARLAAGSPGSCEITFWMNRLLALPGDTPLFVTVDPDQPLDNVWSVREYATPVLDARARAAQQRHDEISGVRNTWYCGSWWGDGLQEDGFASGVEVARALASRVGEHVATRASA
jgi:predicted NAD/FAD-binding protein